MNYHVIFSMLVCITAISAFINDRYFKLPKTIALTIISVSISIIITQLAKVSPNVIYPIHKLLSSVNFRNTVLDVMLGYLLFAGSLHINSVELKKNFLVIIYLASVGVITSTVLTGVILWHITKFIHFNLSFADCLIFGSIISPTDPIAVMSIFRNAKNIPKQIKAKITGEALFNDAVSILLLTILIRIFYTDGPNSFLVSHITFTLVQDILGGIAWGGFVGYVSSFFLSRTDDNEAIILLTVAAASAGYIISGYLHVSGPITMVVAGLLIGEYSKKQRFSSKTSYSLNQFWELIDGILNAFLFVLIGLELLTIDITFSTIVIGFIGLFIIFISRFISILIPSSIRLIYKTNNNKPNWKENFLLCWGGIRGAISIALALATPNLPPYLIAITYLVVIFSILIQGSTLKIIINKFYSKTS
jgi:CPA1 family monovalent cation:H+ antiporter